MNRHSETIDLILRLLIIGAIGAWCFALIRPFIAVIVWGAILAIGLRPIYLWLADRFGGRSVPAAVALTVLGLAVILGPVSVLATSFGANISDLTGQAEAGGLKVPPPPDGVANIPVVGAQLFSLWDGAATNLEATLARFEPQLREIGSLFLSLAASAGVTILQFIVSMILAGVFLTQTTAINRGLRRLVERISPERGGSFVEMTASTIRNVARGVVGISVLQGLLLGIGFLGAGIPLAGLWTLICIFLAIIQIGPGLVIIGTLIYAWTSTETLTALLFTLYILPVSVLDNVLKPIVMARGLPVPMLVIFIGVIGGTLLHGLVGLFIGPVVLSLGYELMRAWVSGPPNTVADGAPSADQA